MAGKSNFDLKDLEVYQLSRELSDLAWRVYSNLTVQQRKLIGDQFLRAVDSVGANIAEGFGRYHHLDKIKFFYNARASMYEAFDHWAELMANREMIHEQEFSQIRSAYKKLQVKLNNFIKSTYNQSKKND